MSIFNSVLGSLSPKFRDEFEDPHAHEHELPLYHSPSTSPAVPPPIASTVLWNAPKASLSPPSRVPDGLLALQRRATHLEQQLQELLDAQADGLMSGLGGQQDGLDGSVSNGSTTPTVSSVRGADRGAQSDALQPRRRKLGLHAARRGIYKRIQQLAIVKADEMDILDDNLKDLQGILDKTEAWTRKRSGLQRKIQAIEGESHGVRTESMKTEASKLEQEIRQKEEELWKLRMRHRKVLKELDEAENSVEAKLASYKTSLSILDNEVTSFLTRPPDIDFAPQTESPFLSLPPKRRTLEMAHDFWQDEHSRLADRCQEVDIDRAALDEGALLWNDIVKHVTQFEYNLQMYMDKAGREKTQDPSALLTQMDAVVVLLEEKMELATSRSWNLLVCAIGAELEAFKQGKDLLEHALGRSDDSKGKAEENLVDTGTESEKSEITEDEEEQQSGSAFRVTRSPPKQPWKQPQNAPKSLYDRHDEDPDPELLISHQDTDTE